MLESLFEPKRRTGFDRNYWIWDEPKENSDYLLVADVARGDGTDFSVAQVFDIKIYDSSG